MRTLSASRPPLPRRLSLLLVAAAALPLLAAAEPPGRTPLARTLRIERIEFSCLAPEHEQRPELGPADARPRVQVFDVWDASDEGMHPQLLDVSVYVTNGEAERVTDVDVELGIRYLVGTVLRFDSGEFAGLIDHEASRDGAAWIPGPGPYRHHIAELAPGQTKKITFRNLSLAEVFAAVQGVRKWLWRVELSTVLRRPGRDLLGQPAPLGRVLEVLPAE